MTICETTDFTYPLLADIYYPIVEQGPYGNVSKTWVLDKTIACSFNPPSTRFKEDINSEAMLKIDNSLIGRVRTDITQSSQGGSYSLTNIVITNIRDTDGNIIYNESAGPRSGLSSIFEIATFNAIVGPFGKLDYYKVIIRRSENQAVLQ